MYMILKSKEYLRSIFFGIEDSLVSTAGLVTGIAVGSDNKDVVLLAGLVAITIEAVSMGVGEYLSDDALQDLNKLKKHKDNALLSGFLMFASYLLAGLIPLAPVALLPLPFSLVVGVILSLIGLFTLGYIKGKILHTSAFSGGIKILVVGGVATLLGLIVGLAFKLK
jgi:vacuolar iron transporter family protein